MKSYTVLGDSIACFYAPYLRAYLPEYRERPKPVGKAFENLDVPVGANCGDSRSLRAYVQALVASGEAISDLYVVNAGLHDVKRDKGSSARQVEDEAYRENIEAVLDTLLRAGARVLFVNTTDVCDEIHNARQSAFTRRHEDVERVNEIAEAACEAAEVPLCDLYGFTRGFGEAAFADHVHYFPKISDAQARFLADAVRACDHGRVYDTLLVGASALAIGFLEGMGEAAKRCAVLEAGGLTAPEFAEAWRADGESAQVRCETPFAASFQAELAARGAVAGRFERSPALAPISARRLAEAGADCLFYARVTGVRASGNGFALRARCLGGAFVLRAARVIDTTDGFELGALLGEPAPERQSPTLRVCAFPFGENWSDPVEVSGARDVSEARRLALSRLSGTRALAMAGRLEAAPRENGREAASGALWRPSGFYPNAVRAWDAGARLARILGEAPHAAPEASLSEERGRFDGEYDVIVAGLGTAGAPCAIRLAETGLRVLGVEQLEYAGGAGTAGGVMGYYFGVRGGSYVALDARAQAIEKERLAPHSFVGSLAKSVAIDERLRALGVCARFGAQAVDVLKKGGRVEGVVYADAQGLHHATAQCVIDATADGALCRLAGCEMLPGRASDGAFMPFSNSVLCYDRRAGRVLNRYRDNGLVDARDPFALGRAVLTSSADELHLLSDYASGDEYLGTAPLLGLREGSRILGEATLTLEDILEERFTNRPAFFCRTNMDHHAKDFALESRLLRDWFIVAGMWGYNVTFPVPVGALIPKGVDGLLVAGRHLSVEHDAALGVRMKDDVSKAADAAAALALLSIRMGVPARDVPYDALRPMLEESGALAIPEGASVERQHGAPRDSGDWLEDEQEIVERLDSDRPGYAIWSCRMLGEASRGLLIQALAEGSASARRHAALALSLIGAREAVPTLLEMLGEGSAPDTSYIYVPTLGVAAVAALGRLAAPEAVEPLLALLENDEFASGVRFTPDSYTRDAEDLRFQYLSGAVAALAEIAKAHEELRERIASAVEKRIFDPDFQARVTMMGTFSLRWDERDSLRRAWLRAMR